MKKLVLAFLMLFGTVAVQSDRAEANGATVVFLKVDFQDYFLTQAIRDKAFNSSKLFDVLESTINDVYVARLDPFVYRQVSLYSALGYDVNLTFSGYEDVTFRYYLSLRAFLGVTSTDQIVVLLPEIPGQKPHVTEVIEAEEEN